MKYVTVVSLMAVLCLNLIDRDHGSLDTTPAVRRRKRSDLVVQVAALWFFLNGLDRFRIAQILFPVDLDSAISTDILRILVELVDLLVECRCLQLTHM